MRHFFIKGPDWFTMSALLGAAMLYVQVFGLTMPVVAFEYAQGKPLIESDGITVTVLAVKIRACKFEPYGVAGYVRYRGKPFFEEAIGLSFPKDTTPGNSKPTGFSSFGLWKWEALYPEDIIEVRATVTHTCSGKKVQTTVGDFKV